MFTSVSSAKGAVPRRHTGKELSAAAVRTRPVLRVFLKGRIAGRTMWAAACLAVLSGCMVGPRYIKPAAVIPPAYKEGGTQTGQDGVIWEASQPRDTVTRGKWWEKFNDPKLNELEEKLNSGNQNVAASAANVLAAKAVVRESRSQFLPTVTASAGITNQHLSTFGPQKASATYSTFSLPVEASWEPDLWGRVRNTVNANSYAAQASVADLENVRLAAQAELALDYYQLRAQDELKRVLDATVSAYRESLDLTHNLCDAGLDSDEAVAQAESSWQAAQAQDTSLGNLRAQYEHAIATLTGQPASTFSIAPAASLNARVPAIPPGLPSQLLERRPDVAAAERAVAQANAQIGIAKTAFFPALTLAATGGFQNLGFVQWFTWPSRIWSVGPNIAETIFDGGLRKATVQQYQAMYDQTVANYRQTVLTAFQQVEDNLAALRVLAQVIEQQEAAIQSADRSLQEATVRYTAGLDPYLNVIAAQTILLEDQQTAVTFRAQQMIASVQLIEALGGGWDVTSIPSADDMHR